MIFAFFTSVALYWRGCIECLDLDVILGGRRRFQGLGFWEAGNLVPESVWPGEFLSPFAYPQGSSNSPVFLMEDKDWLILASVCCSAVMISSRPW